jgi:hypothetical protein
MKKQSQSDTNFNSTPRGWTVAERRSEAGLSDSRTFHCLNRTFRRTAMICKLHNLNSPANRRPSASIPALHSSAWRASTFRIGQRPRVRFVPPPQLELSLSTHAQQSPTDKYCYHAYLTLHHASARLPGRTTPFCEQPFLRHLFFAFSVR